jgi:hypothetical protein
MLLLVALTHATACNRRLEPYIPLDQEPPAVEGPIRIPGLEDPAPRARVIAPPLGQGKIQGTIRVADGVRPSSRGFLFVIVRPAAGGPPVAVRRIPAGPFPVTFEIGSADVMMQGVSLTGPVRIVARLDSDGDPMTQQNGDLVGEVADPIVVPASGVEIVLSPRALN